MKKLRYILAVLTSLALLFSASPALAGSLYLGTASSDEACQTLNEFNPDRKGCNASSGGADSLIALTLNLLSMVAGIIAVIMIIVAGLKYITAQGDSNSISSAKNSLIYAIVGLVVVALAQFIVRFVLSRTLSA